MVRRNSLFILLLLTIVSMTFKSQTGKYSTDKGKISFFSETPMENIKATSSKMAAVVDPSNGNVACVISIATFNFDNSLMKDHFNEKYMESETYPKATFSGSIQEKIEWNNPGAYPVKVKGKLKIHGVEQERTINGTITILNDKKIKLDSQFDVKLVDHKIEVPQMVFNKIAEVIDVKVNAELDLK